jgi:hypothetical protein
MPVVGRRQLDPDPAGGQQVEHPRQAWRREIGFAARQTHVVDHHVERQREQAWGDLGQASHAGPHLHVPAEPREARCDPLDVLQTELTRETRD